MAEPTERELDERAAAELKDEPALSHKPGKLTPEMEREIEERRQLNVLAATIAGLSWGRNMTPVVRRAFADYCARYDVDPITEMDNLGGNPYVNAEWYKRKLGELIVRGIIKDYSLEHVQNDRRLVRIMEDEKIPAEMRATAREKWFHNAMRRIEQNAPEEAEAICICTILLPNGTTAVGCKWAGGGTAVRQPRHQGTAQPNPIAEMNPTLSVESMSIRRAMSQLLTHVSGQRISGMQWTNLEAMNADLESVSAAFRAAQPEREPTREPGHTPMLNATYGEPPAEPVRPAYERIETVDFENFKRDHDPKDFIAFAANADPYGLDDAGPDAHQPNMPQFVPVPMRAALDETQSHMHAEEIAAATISVRGTPLEQLRAIETREQRGDSPTLGTETDLFGSRTAVEAPSIECEECGRMIRPGRQDDHDRECSGYREP